MRFTKMKNVKQEETLNALAELPPAPDGEMLTAFAKAMRVVAAEKTFDEMSVLDIVGASGYTSRTFYNHFRSKYDLLCVLHDIFLRRIQMNETMIII